MGLVPLRPLLELSRRERKNGVSIAHGAFNVNSPAHARGAIRAAMSLNAPLILQASSGACGFMSGQADFRNVTVENKRRGARHIAETVRALAAAAPVPVVLHLDHGTDMDSVKAAVDAGFTSVMIDGSSHALGKNIRLTQEAVDYAGPRAVSVEAEIGALAGVEEHVSQTKATYTDRDEALCLIEATGIDALAISYGTSHGEFKGHVQLDLSIPRELYAEILRRDLFCELVSHGSSSLPDKLVESVMTAIGQAGGRTDIPRPSPGVPVEMLNRATECGISKINVDADIRLAITRNTWTYFRDHPSSRNTTPGSAVWRLLCDNPAKMEPRYYLTPILEQLRLDDRGNSTTGALLTCIEEAVYEIVRQRIVEFGAAVSTGISGSATPYSAN